MGYFRFSLLNVVILHCHFRRGGVTQVVENHVAALSEVVDGKIVLVSGGRNEGLTEPTCRNTHQIAIDQFDYDAVALPHDAMGEPLGGLSERAEHIAGQIIAGFRSFGVTHQDTVLHWHNHSLGKNAAAPLVIRLLAERHGFRQLLQIHDFAEDFRPENYCHILKGVRTLFPSTEKRLLTPLDVNRYCYPDLQGVQYATLTGGDAEVLKGLGIEAGRVHVMPNSVTLGESDLPDPLESLEKIRRAADLPNDSRWCLYPVRGIRRKNVGEFLLLSRMLPESVYAGITLPPATEIESRSYQRWREIGSAVAPKAIFDAGTFGDVSFLENLSASDFVLSTSVAEGFGMAFLEPWLADRGVVARRLPNVIDDFSAAGVCLDRFYDRLEIPGDREWIADCVMETQAAFQTAWAPVIDFVGDQWPIELAKPRRLHEEETIDFAVLTPRRQIEVLRRISRDEGFENAVKESNSKLLGWLSEPFARQTLRDNARLITNEYSLKLSGRRLLGLYNELVRIPHLARIPIADENAPEPPGPDSLGRDVSVIDLICGNRTYYPCRTETEIAT